MLVQNWTNSRVQLRYMDWSALKKSICMYARHARPFSYKRVTRNFCQPGVGSVNVWWTFIDNSRLLPLEVFALYPQGSFCPDHSLEGKIGCSFFFVFNSHLSMRSRGPPTGVCVASPLEVIFFSSPSGGLFSGTFLPSPPDYNTPLILFCTLCFLTGSLFGVPTPDRT